jgi:hypothetical protein
MQHGHDDLRCADALLVHADRDTSAVILDGHGPVEVDGHPDVRTDSCEMLVHGVVDGFPDQVVKARAVVNIADVHAGPFAYGFETFEDGDVVRVVRVRRGNRDRGGIVDDLAHERPCSAGTADR